VTMPPVSRIIRPSTWFLWHGHRLGPGARVVDLACGEGRHSLAAAARGAQVTAVDRDEARLAAGRERAEGQGLSIEWVAADLEEPWPELGTFDAVLMFNYLDRAKMPQIIELIEPGGFLMMETYLSTQRELGWGPTSDDHLLRTGELARLVASLTVVHGREVVEAVDAERWRAVASVLAVKK
jgi:2-polyprenyl-3-methyl-5-hydroxy-6-metoxy-1,4-benzoquinol methylase